MVSTYSAYYSAFKRKEILSRGATWPSPEGAILGEVRESEKGEHHARRCEPVRATGAERGMWMPGMGRGRVWGLRTREPFVSQGGDRGSGGPPLPRGCPAGWRRAQKSGLLKSRGVLRDNTPSASQIASRTRDSLRCWKCSEESGPNPGSLQPVLKSSSKAGCPRSRS